MVKTVTRLAFQKRTDERVNVYLDGEYALALPAIEAARLKVGQQLTDAEIEAYVASGDPFDKAAGYAVQHEGLKPVARVNGCFANVMGLPLCRLYHALERHMEMPAPRLACIAHSEQNCSVEKIVSGQ